MKNSLIALACLLLVVFTNGVPADAAEMPISVQTRLFSVDLNDPGFQLPQGSTIHHFRDGTTDVSNPKGQVIYRTNISKASVYRSIDGTTKSISKLYYIPNGAHVDQKGNTTYVYDEQKRLILTVINDQNKQFLPTYPGDYIEQAEDRTVSNLDYFRAEWWVPDELPDPADDSVAYIFNAIQNQSENVIIQPVLEWNFDGSHAWTAAAWSLWPNGGEYRGTPIDCSVGDHMAGYLWNITRGWNIQMWNLTTSEDSYYYTTQIWGKSNLEVFCALEMYVYEGDGDAPGDIEFFNMSTKYNNSTVDITWDPIVKGPGLTGLAVYVYSDAWVELRTAN